MRESYPVVWCERSGPVAAGSLLLGPTALRLDGVAGGAHATRELRYSELAGVRMAAYGEERLGGRPTLLIEPAGAPALQVASVAGLGVLREVADVLARTMSGD